jgi:hypothetical protein
MEITENVCYLTWVHSNPTTSQSTMLRETTDLLIYKINLSRWISIHELFQQTPVAVAGAVFKCDTSPRPSKMRSVTPVLVGTTVSLISQVYGGMDILFRYQETTSPERIEWAVFSLQCIFVLYVWELIYRLQIGLPLLAHHICCISLCQLVSASFVDTHDVEYLRFAILLGFQATTEQLSFVALLLFRLNYCLQYQSVLLFGAAAMSLVLKTVVTIAALEYYTRAFEFDADVMVGWDYFWAAMLVPIIVVLFTAQVFACNVLYGLGCRCRDSFQDGMQPILKRVHLDASTSCPKEASKEALPTVPSSADAPPESVVGTESAESLMEDGRSPPPPDLFHQVVAIVGDSSLVPVRMATVPEQFRLYGLYAGHQGQAL